ncbi:MAG: PTS glucitol/sorbitol transporter subunit IIA [Chloroflexota bacterium]
MLKYEARVSTIGPYTQEFLDHNIIVLFGDNAPEELVEFSVIHDGKELHDEIQAGDIVQIDDEQFSILAVGEVANDNFRNLGHLVLKFNGADEVEMPGDVCVEKRPLPPIAVGTVIKVFDTKAQ